MIQRMDKWLKNTLRTYRRTQPRLIHPRGSNQLKCLYFMAVLSVLSTTVTALPSDRQQILQLRSDTADLSQEQHRGVYKGNVELDQGTTHLRAAEAITEANAANKLVRAIAKGSSHAQAHFWTITENEKPPLHAFANTIYYYPEQFLIKLVGNACVSQGDNTFRAPKITYDTKRQHVLTTSIHNARTVITFHPDRKP